MSSAGRALPADQFGQVFSLHEFHRKKDAPVDCSYVVHCDDVRMAHAGSGARFGE